MDRTLDFRASQARSDKDRNVVFTGTEGGTEVRCRVDWKTLSKHYGVPVRDAQEAEQVFHRHRSDIEGAAERKYSGGAHEVVVISDDLVGAGGGIPIDDE